MLDSETTASILSQLRVAYTQENEEERRRKEEEVKLKACADVLQGEVVARTAALKAANDALKQANSALKDANEALTLADRRLRVLLRATAQMVWVSDAAGNIIEAEGWTELTGRPLADLTEGRWETVLHPDESEAVRMAWRTAIEMEVPYVIEHKMRMPSGEYETYSVRGTPLLSETGEILEWIGMTTSLSFRAERPIDSATINGREMAGVVVPGVSAHRPAPQPSLPALGVAEGAC